MADDTPLPKPDPRSDLRQAYSDLKKTPVSVLEDFVGMLSPAKAQDNAVRDAIRFGAADTMGKYNQPGYEKRGQTLADHPDIQSSKDKARSDDTVKMTPHDGQD